MRSAKAYLTREELHICDICAPCDESSRGTKYPATLIDCNLMLLVLSSSIYIHTTADCKLFCSVRQCNIAWSAAYARR